MLLEGRARDANLPGMHRSHAAQGTALQVRKRDAEDALAILDAPPLDENYVIEE